MVIIYNQVPLLLWSGLFTLQEILNIFMIDSFTNTIIFFKLCLTSDLL